MVTGHLAVIVSTLVPQLQLVVGGCILFGVCRQGAWALACALFALFALAQSSVLIRGMAIDCGCFGIWTQPVSWFSLFSVATLSILSYWMCGHAARIGLGTWRNPDEDQLLRSS